jgi:hypothetical protein
MTQAKASHTQKEMYQNPTLILDPKNVGWDPEEQLTSLGEGFIVTIFNDDVLLHDYHLHQDNKTTIRNYQLQNFLQTGGIEPSRGCWQQPAQS